MVGMKYHLQFQPQRVEKADPQKKVGCLNQMALSLIEERHGLKRNKVENDLGRL